MQPAVSPPNLPRLRCLRGGPAPAVVARDVEAVRLLPEAARQQLYRVLGPCLTEPVPADTEAKLDAFGQSFGVAPSEVARAVKACRFLLRSAATSNLPVGEFVEDLAALGDTGELSEALLSGYDEAMKLVRVEIAMGVVADHGKVLERVAWRVDHVGLADRGDGAGVPVVMLTLSYLEGGRRDRITLQASPAALRELRAMCDRIL